LWLETTSRGIRRLDFLRGAVAGPNQDLNQAGGPADSGLSAEVERQVAAYFEGSLREFDLPLDLTGSEFQRSVWQAIAAVPFGETLTYAQIAAAVGRPTAYRAVGNACGSNPVVIVVPCHRIVGSDRGLHGFGGGLDVKTWLLRHEGSLSTVQDRKALQLALAGD
jgi:methylated-DNA-[protein]-cysteine S-methyltransferase